MATEPGTHEAALLLDAYVDILLAGEDWRARLNDDRGTHEIVPHMEMAEIVLAVARKSPPTKPDQQTRARMWRRLAWHVGHAISPISVSLMGGGAAQVRGFVP